jgi:PIN domain nuclease of toxin-antitoxin system
MVVLDTHAWLWWADAPERLSTRARDAIQGSDAIGVCSISCWEAAMLALRGRVGFDRDVGDWIRQALAAPGVVALSLTPKTAVAAALLEQDGFVADPADRLIYATAREAGAPLVTRDERLRSFDPRGTLW